MASRKIRDEVMMMTISVNSDPAQQAIYELRKENVAYAQSIEDLKKRKEVLGRRNKANAQEWDDLTSSIKENEAAIQRNKDRMEEHRRGMDISKMTMAQLKKEAELLKRQLNEVVPGSATAIAYERRLASVRDRMAEVNVNARNTQTTFRSLADRFNHYSGIVTAMLGVLVGFGLTVQSVIDRNNKMAEAFSGVEKNVGMTREEVEDLTKSFATLDTRTSKLDLLNIAIGGGRLGVAKENIRDFVEVVDKAVVALGDSWNQAPDKIAESLGKVTTLYSQIRDLPIAVSINQVGSALNELAADGAASEQNVNEFATRVGAMPEKLKPTIADVLGLGAAFEESGIDAERAGTAYPNFIKIAANSVDKFAKVMRLPIEDVKSLINSNPTEFFLKFAEGLKGMDATDLATTLDYLKINDQYVTSILGAASEKTERFRHTLELSNQSMRDATSLTDEFNKVNTNSAAIYEKLQKKMASIFTSDFVAKGLNTLVSAFSLFIGVNENAEKELSAFGRTTLDIIRITAVLAAGLFGVNALMVTYNLLIKESIARQIALEAISKVRNATMIISNGLQTLYTASLGLMGAAYAIVTGNTAQATFAMRGFSAAIMANPIGLIVTLVATLGTALYMLSKRHKEAEEAAKQHNEQLNRLATMEREFYQTGRNAVAKYEESIDNLIRTLKSEIATKEMRKKAYDKLISMHPQFMGTVDREYKATADLARVYAELAKQIEISARAKARAAAKQSIYDEQEKLRIDYVKGEAAREAEQKKRNEFRNRHSGRPVDEVNAMLSRFVGFGEHNKGVDIINKINANSAILSKLNDADAKRIDQLQNMLKTATGAKKKLLETELSSLLGGAIDDAITSNYLVPKDTDKKDKKTKSKSTEAGERRHEKEMDDILRRGEQAKELSRQVQLEIEDAKVEAMDEGFYKEMAQLNLQEKRKLEEIEKKKISESDIAILERKIEKAKEEDKALFKELKLSWLKNNEELEATKTLQRATFEQKRKVLYAKSEMSITKDEENNVRKKLNDNQISLNEELAQYKTAADFKLALRGKLSEREIASIKTWEDGKAALTKVYQKKEIEIQLEHLQAMVALYEGIDLMILSQEQQEQVLKFLDEAKVKISEFKAKANEQSQPGIKKGDAKTKLGGKGGTDILGMSVDDWDQLFSNIQTGTDTLGTLQAAIGAVQQAFTTYYSYVQAQEAAQSRQIDVDAKRREKRYKMMLDTGQINEQQYQDAIQRLNEETERKKAQLEYESAKRQRAIQIGQIIANTAQAIMSIWAQVPKFDFGASAGIMTGVVSALGALQIATVLKTPLPEAPGYEDGFGMNYPIKRQQDGKKFNVTRRPLKSGLVNKPTHFIASENQRLEMVIDESTYKGFSPRLKTALHSEIGYSRGFEGGYYPYLEQKQNSESQAYAEVINNNTRAMDNLVKKRFVAELKKDMETAKELIDMTDEYNYYEQKAKK